MINIYVGNLPYSVDDEQLVGLFEPYGSVTKATIVEDSETGRSRGFGFVKMPEREPGEEAIEALHGIKHGGRVLTINEARPRGSGTGERILGDGTGGPEEKKDEDSGNDLHEPSKPRGYRGKHHEEEAPKTVSTGYNNRVLQ